MNRSVKTGLIIGVALAVLIVVPLIWGGVSGWHGGGWGMMGPWMMGGFGMVAVVLFWALVIWGVVYLVTRPASPAVSSGASERLDAALEVLKKRYARGEIDKEEYEEKKRDLA